MDKVKVLLHVDEIAKWQLTLANTQNLMEDVGGENLLIEIVANAAAVKIFAERDNTDAHEPLLKHMEGLHKKGVQFFVCRNALRGNSIQETLLPAFITVVPAGITRLVMQQVAGYAYIKP